MSRELSLRFWLEYASREGALSEDLGEKALFVLPRAMRDRFDLAETVTVTSDPDVAREEAALLLIPGHPVLDAAAADVLERGDAGTIRLAWPAKAPPATGVLLAAARDRVGVEHGRIDAAGEAVPRYAPLLRVGAGVTYLVNDQFHEREEVWVDGRTGLPVAEELARRLEAFPRLPGGARAEHGALEPNLALAIREAHALLEERAEARRRALARQSDHALRDELAQAEGFYDAALESIAQRLAAAPPDRQKLLDAQAHVTRSERARRLQEIREKFEARHEIRPVRLHLLLVPAMHLPVAVRRGERGFPFALTWWLPAAQFTGVRCPACGAAAPLVAARDRLGCQACVARPPAPVELVGPAEAVAPRRSEPARAAPQPPPKAPRATAAPPSSTPAPPPEVDRAREAQESGRDYEQLRRRVVRAGNRLAPDFWEAMLNGDAWPRKRADPNSPLRALYRLYGAEGPLRGVGIPPGAFPAESTFATADPGEGLLNCTSGRVTAGGRAYRYTLRWHLEAGKPAIDEVLPYPHACGPHFPPVWAQWRQNGDLLYEDAPAPRAELDSVAAALWRSELPASGLPLVVRCLAAWWRIAGEPGLPERPPPVLAAALAATVGRRAGLNRSREAAARDHGADAAQVAAAARRLQALLQLSDTRSW